MEGYIHSLESFGSVDGPGIRFVIFVSGCPMRCAYCHNPDTWVMEKGEKTDSAELVKKALRYKPYWSKGGGVTVSGGEPLMQIDFLLDLFKKLKAENINTCIDTSGAPFTREEPFFSKFKELMEYTDLLLVDIKHIDLARHVVLTGHGNQNTLEMLKFLSEIKKPVWVRHVLVPKWTDDDKYLTGLRAFIDTLGNVKRVEVLPYHTLGAHKWKSLGIPYRLNGIDPPSNERVENAKKILGAH